MNAENSQPIALERLRALQTPQPKTPSKRLPSKGKQAIAKPLVPCQISIERIGTVQRTNTPYIVYRTPYGRCCTFVSRRYLMQSLFNLLSITHDWTIELTAIAIAQSRVTVKAGDTRHSIADREVLNYLERQNQAACDRLQVNLLDRRIIVWNPNSNNIAEVMQRGCTCNDIAYHQSYCKHRIAAHLYLQQCGWESLRDYLESDYRAIDNFQAAY